MEAAGPPGVENAEAREKDGTKQTAIVTPLN
jgi:hypothetical protein